MKKSFFLSCFLLLLSDITTLSAQSSSNLNATSFSSKMKQIPNAQIIDVRTPGEFMQSHIENAININIASNDFQQKIATLNSNKAVFVYCLSGSRSSYAMNILKSMGFKEIYNLAGGMMQWRAANLSETTANSGSKQTDQGLTLPQYRALLNSNKLVLVDFYADWCAPCKKMKPYLDEISFEMKDKVVVKRIDADANKVLARELKVDALPVLLLYKGNKLVWSYKGYISKEEVLKKLKTNQYL